MPIVSVQTRSGLVNFNCTISTPTTTDALSIDPNLPTILFMHGPYLPQIAFQSQFSDPLLRKFNLVTFDFRVHGETTGAEIPEGYGQEDVADDVLRLMDTLSLPSCHIMAVSLGTVIALEIAITHPERCLSLLLISPLGLEEAEELKVQHAKIHEYWRSGYPDHASAYANRNRNKLNGHHSSNDIDANEEQNEERVLEEVLKDVFYGCVQMAFSGQKSEMSDACLSIAFTYASRQWSPLHSPSAFDQFRYATLDLYNNRKAFGKSRLSKIRKSCPIRMFTGEADRTETPRSAVVLERQMREVGLEDVGLVEVDGAPHLVSVHHAGVTNSVLHSLVMQHHKATQPSVPIPDAPTPVFSPWTPILRRAGWIPEGEDEEADAGLIMHHQGFSSTSLNTREKVSI
ncbi:alpha/beta-hydrolase [Dendrothele bispora CBS 962.96]|uniref:Alpha/beta-hydrolase n=1 Tax=Dendrothele bispora (strain CBS 962.96) TaxID=1314807 RepID=A0A4S8MVJ9_DENBC|nr:alpha/beta-hydrolase [Dendrothele bispora CBS 962.96]